MGIDANARDTKKERIEDAIATDPSLADDVFDDTYKEKQGPKPPMRLVWRNIILMSILHTLALYGVTCVSSAKLLTLAWCKLNSNSY